MRPEAFFATLATAFIFAFEGSAIANDVSSYVCVADQTTGFVLVNGSWMPKVFKEERKFVLNSEIAFIDDLPFKKGDQIWRMTETGAQGRQGQGELCHDLIRLGKQTVVRDVVQCGSSLWGDLYYFHFNKKTLRFVMSFNDSFLNDYDLAGPSPVTITIGKCSPL